MSRIADIGTVPGEVFRTYIQPDGCNGVRSINYGETEGTPVRYEFMVIDPSGLGKESFRVIPCDEDRSRAEVQRIRAVLERKIMELGIILDR